MEETSINIWLTHIRCLHIVVSWYLQVFFSSFLFKIQQIYVFSGNQAIKKTTEELDGRNPPQMLQLLRNVINRNDQGQGQEGNLQDAKALAVLKALLAGLALKLYILLLM